MTDRISLDDLPPPMDAARRDQWGRYLVVPPDGGKPVGYTRVTTVAKSLDDGGGLAPWKAAMTASGIIMRRGLRAQWEALIAQHGDPWYGSRESKATAKRLVEESSAIGGANDRKEVGTALHALTAMIDLGQTPQHLTVETERDLAAYSNGLVAAGISIIPGAVELCIVLDSVQVAGTFDRLAIVPGFELPLIADLKTGSNLDYSWNSIAVQLAAYSRGEAIYRQGAAKDGSQDVRRPMPAVNQDWGLVMALDASNKDAPLDLWLVDLNAGWRAFALSMQAREWRKETPARSLLDNTPLPPVEEGGDILPVLEASLAVTKARGRAKRRHPANETPQQDRLERMEAAVVDGYQVALRQWLQGRIDDIGAHERARQTLVTLWPRDIPPLRTSDEHTYEQLAIIESLCDDIEKSHSLGFPTARPGAREDDAALARVVHMFPGTTTISNDTGATKP